MISKKFTNKLVTMFAKLAIAMEKLRIKPIPIPEIISYPRSTSHTTGAKGTKSYSNVSIINMFYIHRVQRSLLVTDRVTTNVKLCHSSEV